jgi:hypothetical protein
MLDRKVDALYLEAPTEQFRAIILYTVEPWKTPRVRYPHELRSVKVWFELLK